MTRRLILLFAALLLVPLLVVIAVPVHAGGWATVGITEMPEEIVAGRPFTLQFMVWQHGNKAVHEISWDGKRMIPIKPLVSFGSAEAGQKLMFDAQPAKEPGLFTAEIMLPEEGEYVWTIAPQPLAGVTEFEPLTVIPAGTGTAVDPVTAQMLSLAGITFPLWAAAAGLLFLAVFALALRTRSLRNKPTTH
jgi:hypothetical protein